jgi:hypothetical protein
MLIFLHYIDQFYSKKVSKAHFLCVHFNINICACVCLRVSACVRARMNVDYKKNVFVVKNVILQNILL